MEVLYSIFESNFSFLSLKNSEKIEYSKKIEVKFIFLI